MKIASNTAKLLRNVPLPDEIATVHDNAVIVDMGSGTTRVGFGGDDAPRLVSRTVVGAAKAGGGGGSSGTSSNAVPPVTTSSGTTYECFSGAYKNRASLTLSSCMERGMITNWNGVEALLMHLDGLLGMSRDSNTPLLLSEAALVPQEQRDQLTQILFEKIKVPSVYFGVAPVLGLYASGRTTGMVVEMGHGSCHTVPVYEGFSLFHSILQMDFGGSDLTQHVGRNVVKVLGGEGGDGAGAATIPIYSPHFQTDIWTFLKEMYCPVAADRATYAKMASGAGQQPMQHALPDGTVVELGSGRFAVCEALFDPTLIDWAGLASQVAGGSAPGAAAGGKPTSSGTGAGARARAAASGGSKNAAGATSAASSSRGLHHLAAESIRKCDADVTALLCSNVVLTGGGSLFAGLPERLNHELQDLLATEKVKVHAATERELATFVGGSILASLPTFQDAWVTKGDYNEYGSAQVTTRNCF